MSSFTHIDKSGQAKMVDVSNKKVTERMAKAQCKMYLGKDILDLMEQEDIQTKKGPVFHTAIIAGIMAAKNTSNLIPMCHPLPLQHVSIDIEKADVEHIKIMCKVRVSGKTGVEMEALTGANIAALTVYDMCKAISQQMRIVECYLVEKTGGKSDFKRT